MAQPLPIAAIAYFVVWVLLAVTFYAVFRIHRDPEFRIRWYAKIGAGVSLVILFFMFWLVPNWQGLLLVGVAGGLIIYLNVTKTTICTRCGKIIQPVGFLQRAQCCPHCGGATVPSKLFGA